MEVDRVKRQSTEPNLMNMFSCILDIREYDVLYHTRVMVDVNIRCSYWYKVSFGDNTIRNMEQLSEMTDRPDLVVLAFDIETHKAPMKFPDAKVDQIMLISYVIDGAGYLITNRDVASASNIDHFGGHRRLRVHSGRRGLQDAGAGVQRAFRARPPAALP